MPLRLGTSGGEDVIDVDVGPIIGGGRVERSNVPRWRSGRCIRLATSPLLVMNQVGVEGV